MFFFNIFAMPIVMVRGLGLTSDKPLKRSPIKYIITIKLFINRSDTKNARVTKQNVRIRA